MYVNLQHVANIATHIYLFHAKFAPARTIPDQLHLGHGNLNLDSSTLMFLNILTLSLF